jgi:hypothetical protein
MSACQLDSWGRLPAQAAAGAGADDDGTVLRYAQLQ